MNITTKNENDVIKISVNGWLDTVSSPLLGEEVDKISSASQIILDFDKVEYIASSGLRQIVSCYKKAKEMKADFSVINVGNEVISIFRLTGIDKKITVKEKE